MVSRLHIIIKQNDPYHPIKMAQEKKKSQHNTPGSQFATKRINTTKYQNSTADEKRWLQE